MAAQPETGSPHAAEFNKMLASDMPLVDAVRQWDRTIGPSIRGAEMEDLAALTPAEAAAFGLTAYDNWDT
jgi:hypothetical protein